MGILAVIAQREGKAVGERTKAALAAAKARGTVLGCPGNGVDNIAEYSAKGVAAKRAKAVKEAERVREAFEVLGPDRMTLNAMAGRLNADSVTTRRGKQWTATAVKRTLALLHLA